MLEQTNLNHPSWFWQIGGPHFSNEDWGDAYQKCISDFGLRTSDFKWKSISPSVNKEIPLSENSMVVFINKLLFEQQFDQKHYQLSPSKKLFYQLKPFIPRFLQIALRKIYRTSQEKEGLLKWPIEDRYVRLQYELIAHLMKEKGLSKIPYISFWPGGKDFAFVLTHDVETKEGFNNIPKLVELEKQYGFHSIFNIVPERYPIDKSYLDSLRADGFEIGIHGLKHDGKLFFSRKIFSKRAQKINAYLKEYNAKGFRSPVTHRNPEWMQELEIEYDMSFFDTDPYETMPGGTMSIWPFFMGRFVELPYTLVQDHTLLVILGEVTPRLWLKKVDFIEKYRGMALVIVHPDYMIEKEYLKVYEQFLKEMSKRNNYWHALPGKVARWWRERSERKLVQENGELRIVPPLEHGTIKKIVLVGEELIVE